MFSNRNKTILCFLLVIFIVSTTKTTVISAYEEPLDIGYSTWNDFVGNMDALPQANNLATTTGDLVYASVVHGSYGDYLRIRVIDEDGTIQINTDEDYSSGSVARIMGIRVFQIDDTRVGIIYTTIRDGTFKLINMYSTEISLLTYTITAHDSVYLWTTTSSSQYLYRMYVSNPFNYTVNGDMYFFYIANIEYPSNADMGKYGFVYYDVSTSDIEVDKAFLDWNDADTQGEFTQPYLTPLSETTFMCWIFDGATATPQMSVYDIIGHTLTSACTFPDSYRMNYNTALTFIDSGMKNQEVGNYTYYYPYLVYSTGENLGAYTPAFQVVYLRGEFNGSIASANLIDCGSSAISVSPYSAPSDSGNPWTTGYLDDDEETIYIYHAKYSLTEYDGYYSVLNKIKFNITDFYDVDCAITLGEENEDYETSIIPMGASYRLYRLGTSDFQVSTYPQTEDVWVYYGLGSFVDDFEVLDMYLPNDYPLYQNTAYTFYYTVNNGGESYQGAIVLLYVDDLLVGSKVTDGSGTTSFTIVFGTLGSHTIQTVIFKPYVMTTISDETESYIVVSIPIDELPTDEENFIIFGDNLSNVVMDLIPIAVCVLFPAYALGKKGGFMGFLGGFIVGVAIAVNASLIPVQYAYLLALVVVMGVVFAIRNGNGGMN